MLRPLRPRPLIHRKMGTAMRGQRPALASLLAWVAMLALLLGTLPLLPHGQAGMAVQMPLEERGGEAPLQEEAPAKLRRCAAAPVKAAEKAHPPLLLASQWLRTELELVPATPAMPGVRRVHLTAAADNTAAIALYTALGFVEYGREPESLCVNGEMIDEVLMSCLLR